MLGYSPKKYDVYGIIGLAVVIIFAAGRNRVGTDFVTYMNIFKRYAAMEWGDFFSKVNDDILFNFINKITYSIGGRVFTWGVIAALIVIPIYSTVKKHYSDMDISCAMVVFLLLMYTTSFNVSREFIAVAIVFWGMKYVFENKFFKFALCVIIATMFHASAFVAITFWLFWSHKTDSAVVGNRRVLLIIAATIAVLGYQSIISFFSSNVSLFESYASYANDKDGGSNREFYLNLLVLFVISKLYKKFKDKDPRLEFLFSLLIVANLIGITGFSHPQVKRLAYYFSVPSQVIIFGYLPFCVEKHNKAFTTVSIYLYAIARFTLTAYILEQGHLIPYRFDLFG